MRTFLFTNNFSELVRTADPTNAVMGRKRMYLPHSTVGSAPRTNVADLQMSSHAESGDYVVVWNVDVTDESNKGSILAYYKAVPDRGGYVALVDGSPELVSKEQFAAMEKAKPRSSIPDNDKPNSE